MLRGWSYCVTKYLIGCILILSTEESRAAGECNPNEFACVQFHSRYFTSEKMDHHEWSAKIEGNSSDALQLKLGQLQRHFETAIEDFNRNIGLTQVSRNWIARQCLHQPEFFRTESTFLDCVKKGIKLNSPASPQQQLALQDLLTLRELRARQGMLKSTYDQTPSLQAKIKSSEAFIGAFEQIKTRLTQPRSPRCMPRNANTLDSQLEACLSGCIDSVSIPDTAAACHKLKTLGIEKLAGKGLIRVMAFQDGQSLLAVTRIKAAEKLLKGYVLLTGQALRPNDIPSSCRNLETEEGQSLAALQPTSLPAQSILNQNESQLTEATHDLLELNKTQKEACTAAIHAQSCTRALDTRQTICLDDPIERQQCDLATEVFERSMQLHPNLIPHHPRMPLIAEENLTLLHAIDRQPKEILKIIQESENYKIQEALHEICSSDWKSLLSHPLGDASANEAIRAGVAGEWSKKCLDNQKRNIAREALSDLPAVCLTAAPFAMFVPAAAIPMSLACTGSGILMKTSIIKQDIKLAALSINCAGLTPDVCKSDEFQRIQKEIHESIQSIFLDLALEGAAPALAPAVGKGLSFVSLRMKRLFALIARVKGGAKSLAESETILAELRIIRSTEGAATHEIEEAAPQTEGFKEIIESIESFVKRTPSGDAFTNMPIKSGFAHVDLDYLPVHGKPPLVGLEMNDPVRVKRSDGSSSVGKILEIFPNDQIKVGFHIAGKGDATKMISRRSVGWAEGTTVSWINPSGKRVPAVVKWHEPGKPVMIEYFENGRSQVREVPIEDFSLQSPITRLKQKHVYTAKSGDQVVIDPDSPILREQVNRALSVLQSRTGLVPGDPTILKDPQKRQLIYKTWLEEVVPLFEDKAKRTPEIYGTLRNQLTQKEGGKIDLGTILKERGAVCRELSMLGHLLLGEYGIESKMISATLMTRDGRKLGRHAWLELEGGARYLDNNLKRDYVDPSKYPLFESSIRNDYLSH